MIRAPSPNKLDEMAELLDEFAILCSQRRAARHQQMDYFLTLFQKRHYELQTQGPVDFNIFSILGVSSDEVRHSAFVAWLVDARAGHRQGELFLQSFLGACGISIDPAALDDYEVLTEHSGRESIIDIVVWARGDLLVYIENKVNATEGQDQLAREFRDMRRTGESLGVPVDRQFAVFLTPRGRKPTSGDSSVWIPVSYPQLAQGFSRALDRVDSEKVRHVVEDWIAAAITIGGGL